MRNFFENGNSFKTKKINYHNLDYEKWMKFILRRNKEVSKFELPISAVIIDEKGRCIGRGSNKREINNDPLGHAEIIALKKAGILDTVKCINSDSKRATGFLFDKQNDKALRDCINFFEEKKLWLEFSSEDINLWAQNFSIENFKKKFASYIFKSLEDFK